MVSDVVLLEIGQTISSTSERQNGDLPTLPATNARTEEPKEAPRTGEPEAGAVGARLSHAARRLRAMCEAFDRQEGWGLGAG